MKYEVTAKIVIEADSPQEAIEMFDGEYRDPFNVVHLHAELAVMERDCSRCTSQTMGERRNGFTAVYR